ncbi:MAG: Rha family transcriptional regulator [Magnetococcales bacterium]|nr:Rha family transcriptional regulator [Magnetococcales bacterium]
MTTKTNTTQEIQLVTHQGTPMVTSMVVAEKFGKRHTNVLRAIENLKRDCSENFTGLNFELSEYQDPTGRSLPMIKMTRDGFSLLAMGFTGPKAIQWKIKFIEAFNKMENHILRDAKAELRKARQAERRSQLEWQANRTNGKVVRHDLTDAIKEFIEYAKKQGSQKADRYYESITRMVNDIILGKHSNKDPHFRDKLDAGQLMLLANAEKLAGQVLFESMQQALPYKACYQAAKDEVSKLAKLMKRFIIIPSLGCPSNSPSNILMAV